MRLEQNYIDLFSQNRSLIDGGSAGVMNALRQRALDCLVRNGLPHKGLEEYLFYQEQSLELVGENTQKSVTKHINGC